MRYIKQKQINTRQDRPIALGDNGLSESYMHTSDAILFACRNYQPNPEHNRVLSIQEIRHFYKLMDSLEETGTKIPFIELTDEEHQIAIKLCEWILPFLPNPLFMIAPEIIDLLIAASDHPAEEVSENPIS